MRINLARLEEQGFEVDNRGDEIIIWPKHPADPKHLVDLLQETYGVGIMFVDALLEQVHNAQIFTAIMKD